MNMSKNRTQFVKTYSNYFCTSLQGLGRVGEEYGKLVATAYKNTVCKADYKSFFPSLGQQLKLSTPQNINILYAKIFRLCTGEPLEGLPSVENTKTEFSDKLPILLVCKQWEDLNLGLVNKN